MTTSVNGIAISALPVAALPLDGTELVPIVKGGVTSQTPASSIAGASPGSVSWTGVAVMALAAGQNNDIAPVLIAASRLALTLTGDSELTGIAGGSDGKVLLVQNRDLVDTLTMTAQSGNSAAANRFAINGDLIVPPMCGALFVYDGTINRWVKS